MSRMLFVLRYRNDEPEPLEMELVQELLAPYIAAADEDLTNGVLIRTTDGYEVDVNISGSVSPSTASRPASSSTSWPSRWTGSGRV
ncbi:hypothetical protein [Streptomyces sp. NPDC058240]|uniref:hypothetical protein n=1 Tax=Streptomyces sp. NPDC058240 TaxID=3346396 RepID=UPI0036ECC987